MKLRIQTTLKNINENTIEKEETIAIKQNKKLIFKIKEDKYILKIISPNNVILNRNNNDIECTMYFNLNKKTNSLYTIKKEDYNLEIEIQTNFIKISDNSIIIHYNVIDSNSSYEYHIEMSEYNEYKK